MFLSLVQFPVGFGQKTFLILITMLLTTGPPFLILNRYIVKQTCQYFYSVQRCQSFFQTFRIAKKIVRTNFDFTFSYNCRSAQENLFKSLYYLRSYGNRMCYYEMLYFLFNLKRQVNLLKFS